MLSGKPNDALNAYLAALEISPNRFNSLFGAGNAAQLAGNLDKAKLYYSKLIELTNGTESERTEIKEVTSFMANK
jgi:tetratricopeptide (TPR) repeat protein